MDGRDPFAAVVTDGDRIAPANWMSSQANPNLAQLIHNLF